MSSEMVDPAGLSKLTHLVKRREPERGKSLEKKREATNQSIDPREPSPSMSLRGKRARKEGSASEVVTEGERERVKLTQASRNFSASSFSSLGRGRITAPDLSNFVSHFQPMYLGESDDSALLELEQI